MSLLLGVALMVAMASPKPDERTEPRAKAAPHETVSAPRPRVAPPPQRIVPPAQRVMPPNPPHVISDPIEPRSSPLPLPTVHRIPIPPGPRRIPTPTPAPVQPPQTPAPTIVNNNTYNNYDDDDRYDRGYYENYGYNGYYNGFNRYGNWGSWDTFYAWYPTLVYYGYLPQGYQLADASGGPRLLQAYRLKETQCNQSGLVIMWWPDRTATCAYPNDLVGPGDYNIDTNYLTLTSIK